MDMDKLRETLTMIATVSQRATDADLHDDGHCFLEPYYNNLTSCSHGDCGYYGNEADGHLVSLLWNAQRQGLAADLLALTEDHARLKAAAEDAR